MPENEFKQQLCVSKKGALHIVLIILTIIVGLFLLCLGSSAVYVKYYSGRVYPGVYIDKYPLGGLTAEEVKNFIETFNDRLVKEGLDFYFTDYQGNTQNFKQNVLPADGSSVELVRVESGALAETALNLGRSGSLAENIIQPFIARFKNKIVVAQVDVQEKFIENIKNYLEPFRADFKNANIKIMNLDPLQYEITKEQDGFVFKLEELKSDILNNLSELSFKPLEIKRETFKPAVIESEAALAADKITAILAYGNFSLDFINPKTQDRQEWVISADTYKDWLEVRKVENGDLFFGLNKEKVSEYLETLRPSIDVQPKDARFVVQSEKVEEFQASQSGILINVGKTYGDIDASFRDRNYGTSEITKAVNISVEITEPSIQISDLNSLGIVDILGAGTSTFRDSHTNRIKNIANAVKRLNGILIKPGEEFSANKFAGPYTRENGFLPEMVIKGDRIIPEIGGGMCQIGTTLFRMAMNSGMPITERRNHSLVVGYYADPVNGNPGTDATLYEPDIDFRFLNDTGNYILLQTEIDYKKQMLTFTLWGKKDGRSGSYSRPVVSKWIPAGKLREIESDTLKPGERKCQNAFRGAIASFVYTRITPQGEKIEKVYDSVYRALPQICLVGKSTAPLTGDGGATSTPLIE